MRKLNNLYIHSFMHDFILCYIKKIVNKWSNEHIIWWRNEKYKENISKRKITNLQPQQRNPWL